MTVLWAGCAEMFRPASLAAITHVVAPEQRRQAFALNRLAINLGMSIGPALGGFLATVSFHAMFAVDAVTTLLAGTLLAVTPWRSFSGVNSEAANRQGPRVGPATILHDGRFLVFLGGVILVGIVFFQHESACLFISSGTAPVSSVLWMLFTINTLLIVGLEVRSSPRPRTGQPTIADHRVLSVRDRVRRARTDRISAGVIATVVVWTFGRCFCSAMSRTWPRSHPRIGVELTWALTVCRSVSHSPSDHDGNSASRVTWAGQSLFVMFALGRWPLS